MVVLGRNAISMLQTATKRRLQIGRLVTLHIHLHDQCTWVRFDIVLHFSINAIHCASFIHRVIRSILLLGHKSDPCHHPPVANPKIRIQIAISVITFKKIPKKKKTKRSENMSILRNARKIFKWRTRIHVKVDTNSGGLKMTEPQILSISCYCNLAVQIIMQVSPKQSFYVLCHNFAAHRYLFSKQVKTAAAELWAQYTPLKSVEKLYYHGSLRRGIFCSSKPLAAQKFIIP